DYYPFGMQMPNRFYNGTDYRYGFNGKEKDDEIKGLGAQYDYGFRIYDSRIGRFLSTDPLFAGYPYYTPYQFAGNRPIWAVDLDGLEELTKTRKRIVLINVWGQNVNRKYFDKKSNEYIQPSEEIVEQGDPGADVEIETISYHYAGAGYFNKYVSTSTVEPSIPATDPNDNTKEINPEPLDNDEKPVLEVKKSNEINKEVEQVNLNKVDEKVVPLPVKKKKVIPPPLKKGDIESTTMGLMYPIVSNSGYEWIDQGTGQFPAKDLLTKIVKKVNSSPKITQITVSGEAEYGEGANGSNVRSSFYTGLRKLVQIFRNLGLNNNVRVQVDYQNTRAKLNGKFKVNFKYE
uniref:RHS repeat domain-containing protein n=1 Tax=Flavobacterium sp. C4GT6 TaxID=3103818 RepID=UPI002ED1D933